ncbi:MAG: glycoside hydrolase family 125 protein, partial [Chloroflexota bacterium]
MPTLFEALLKPYRRRWLDPAAGYKPLDFGSGAITGSVNQDGRITAVSTYDPQHGYVTLTSAPPFPENARYDAEQVRAYRRGLVALEGFGLEFRASVVSRSAYLIEDAIPMIRLTLADGVVADCVTFVPEDSARDVIQIWAFSEAGQHARLSGQMWLQRAAYTQLTEGGPVAMPPVSTTQVFDHTGVTPVGIMNEAVNWRVHFTSGTRLKDNVDGSVSFDKALLQVDESEWIYPQTIREGMHLPGVGLASSDETVPPIRTAFFHFHFDYRAGGDVRVSAEHTDIKLTLKEAQTALVNLLDIWRERWHAWRYKHERQVITDLPLRRAVVYGLNCCVPVDHEAVCILTDHMLLPLSWNRDSYYVARGLLNWRRDMQEIIRRHLIWLFERAERVNGGWGRSYLANGTVKDRGFQLDQQLFPVIELTEYTLETQDRVTYQRLRSRVADVLDMLDLHRDSETGLYSTEETPADDPIAFPYHLSSHILMWRMLDLLVRLEGEHFDKRPIGKMRDQIREAVNTYFVTNYADSALYAYATDGMGHYHLYHDANDVPVVFAPFWGMLASDDSVWSQTIDFAFSAANKGGFHGGHLGSVHTPAAWPLGDIQEIVAAAAVGDTQRAKSARQHLAQAACWDGALPEAYDPDTYQVVSRHWFAWPNAMLACLDIEQHPASEPTVIDETPSRLKSPQLAQRRRTSPMNIGFISTRLAGVDGVSLETAKMVQVLEEMGHQCFYIAGEFDSTAKPGWLVPSMHFYDPVAHSIHDEVFRNPNPSPKTFRRIYSIADNIRNELMAFIEEYDIDLIVPQN